MLKRRKFAMPQIQDFHINIFKDYWPDCVNNYARKMIFKDYKFCGKHAMHKHYIPQICTNTVIKLHTLLASYSYMHCMIIDITCCCALIACNLTWYSSYTSLVRCNMFCMTRAPLEANIFT